MGGGWAVDGDGFIKIVIIIIFVGGCACFELIKDKNSGCVRDSHWRASSSSRTRTDLTEG